MRCKVDTRLTSSLYAKYMDSKYLPCKYIYFIYIIHICSLPPCIILFWGLGSKITQYSDKLLK